MSFRECFRKLSLVINIIINYLHVIVQRECHPYFFNTLIHSFYRTWKYQNCWPYRLINFTSLLSAAVCQVRYVLILQIWETCLQNYVYSLLSEHLRRSCSYSDRRDRRFLMLGATFEKRDCHQRAETDTVIIFLPSNYRAPSCQCARLLHQLTSTRKRRLNLRATISWPAKRRARSIAISDRAYMSPCVARVHVHVQRHLRLTSSEFKKRIINSSS